MRFQFRLQKALEMARAREDQKKRELGLIQGRIVQLESADRGISAEMLEILAGRLQRDAFGEVGERRVEFLRAKATEVAEMLQAVREMRERCLREIQKEFGKRKALESLKDKKETEFRKANLKREQKRLEELYRHARIQEEN